MRRVENLTLDNLAAIGERSSACVFWETMPSSAPRSAESARELKEAWVSETLLSWGSCGKLLLVDGQPAGHVLYAPPAYVPRASAFATAPISADAVLLMTAHVDPEHAGSGYGRLLLQHVARDLSRRGVRAIEAFGRTTPFGGHWSDDSASALGCLLPAEFLRATGFKTVRPHPLTPRLRMDIRTLLTLREDVESALERLLGTITAPVPALGRHGQRASVGQDPL